MYEPDTDSVQKALEAFILSASGWRKIFAANGDEESRAPEIRPEDALLTALAACRIDLKASLSWRGLFCLRALHAPLSTD